jgi:TRAP-type transport system periplasmic protein
MKKVIFLLLVSFAAVTMMYAGAQQEGAAEDAEPIVLTFSHMNAVGTPTDLSSNKFKELVEAKTNGRVEVRVHPAGQLGDDKQNIEGLKLGTIDIAYNNPESLSNLIPEFSVFALPYMFNGYDHVTAAMDGKVGQGLEKMLLEQEDIRLLSWFHNGFRDMLTIKKEIHTLEDFKGVKFRSPQIPVYVMMFEALGASPTPIPWPEVYTAMKSKVVDGMETTPQGMYNEKMYEVSNYVIKTRHLFTADLIIMSEASFKGLPKDIQDAIIEAAAEVEPWQRELAFNNNEGVYTKLAAEGMTVIDLEPDVKADLRKACRSVWTELSKDTPMVMELADEISALAK